MPSFSSSSLCSAQPGAVRQQKNEPLNTCTSLDVPLNDEELEGNTLADIIEDENAVDAVAMVEQEDEYRILHEVVNGLKYPQNYVINKYYFDNWTFNHIGDILHASTERVRQIRQKALASFFPRGVHRREIRQFRKTCFKYRGVPKKTAVMTALLGIRYIERLGHLGIEL